MQPFVHTLFIAQFFHFYPTVFRHQTNQQSLFWNICTKIIISSCRLRLKFSCMMELSRYPLDRQICDMQIASCKYIILTLFFFVLFFQEVT